MKIFISYRRDDSADATGRLFDRLEQHYGADEVFMDVDTIPIGVDFRKHLRDAVSKCDVLLAIIGERWVGAGAAAGRRLDDPRDFVRIEVESALARGIPVVPVLVGSAAMPAEGELPDSLKDLAYRNAAELRSGRYFRQQLDHLIRGLERLAQSMTANAVAPPTDTQPPTRTVPPIVAPEPNVPTVEMKPGSSEILCLLCRSALTVRSAYIGQKMRCPFCQTIIVPVQEVPKCPACLGARLPGAVACMDCGYLFETEVSSSQPASPAQLCTNPACGVANPLEARTCQRCDSPLPTPAGTLIQNRYRIEKLLTMGGFGSIYLATDISAQSQVVVKDMLCSDPQEFALRLSFFRREAELLRLLAQAPAVPRFYDLIVEGQNAHLVMEYLKGKDLLRIMEANDNRPYPLDQVIQWGIVICDVLQAMHTLSPAWVHRDLKPDNLILTDDGSLKLIDYGTARSLGGDPKELRRTKDRERAKTRVYTEGYAPPEQIIGRPEPRSDIFGLAATLYHLATGKSPEGFYTAQDLDEQLKTGKIGCRPEDRWFYELLKINLAEDYDDRYFSVRWFKTDLERRKLTKGIICPKCQTVNKLRIPYCTGCNAPMTPKLPPCKHCGTVNRMGSRQCKQCQNRVGY